MKFDYGKLLLLVAILIGSFARLYKLGEVPVSLYWDEAAIGVDAMAVSTWGRDMHGNPALQAIYPSYGDYKLPLYILIDSIAVRLFDLSSWSVRLPSAMAGIGLIYIIYLLTYELFKNKKIAGGTALLLALMPVDILFSRTGFEGHLATLFIAISLYLWLKSVKAKYWLLLSSLTSALAVYSYFSARIVIPLMAGITFIALFRETSKKWKVIFVICFGLWYALLLPIFRSPYYQASNQFRLSTQNLMDTGPFAVESNIYREQSGNSILSRIVYHRYWLQGKAILENVVTHFEPEYLFFTGDKNLRHSTGMVGITYLGVLPLLILGGFTLGKKKPLYLIWLIGLWLASIVPAAIPTEVPHALRSLNSILGLTLLSAYGTDTLYKNKPKWFWLIIGFIGLEIVMFSHDYFKHYPSRSAENWQDGYFQLADYLQDHQSQFDTTTIDFPDGRLFLYFLFVNKTKPEIMAQNSKGFNILSFDKYKFEGIDILGNNSRNWLVVTREKWQKLGQPPAKLIPTPSSVQFAIINGVNE